MSKHMAERFAPIQAALREFANDSSMEIFMKNRTGVWILSYGGSWFVGVGAGYYSRPLPKTDAIRQAQQLARQKASASANLPPIEVFGEHGELIERVV